MTQSKVDAKQKNIYEVVGGSQDTNLKQAGETQVTSAPDASVVPTTAPVESDDSILGILGDLRTIALGIFLATAFTGGTVLAIHVKGVFKHD